MALACHCEKRLSLVLATKQPQLMGFDKLFIMNTLRLEFYFKLRLLRHKRRLFGGIPRNDRWKHLSIHQGELSI
jgi:hypothetical protein